jgi:hypothetical protein
MATTHVLAATTFTAGQYISAPAATDLTGLEKVTYQLIVTQITDSQMRFCIFDENGNRVKAVMIDGTDTQTITLSPPPKSITGTIECLKGSARVAIDQLTGGDQEAFPLAGWDATFLAGMIPPLGIPVGLIASVPLGLTALLTQSAGALGVTVSGHYIIDGDAYPASSMAAPTLEGQVIQLTHKTGTAAITVTVTDGLDDQTVPSTALNFAAALTQSVILVGKTSAGAALRWRVLWQTPGIPAYIPIIPDVADGVSFDVSISGVVGTTATGVAGMAFGAGRTRVLPVPTFEGQIIRIDHTGTDAFPGVVTVTGGFNGAGCTKLYFQSTAAERQSVTLVGVRTAVTTGLNWRILVDNNKFPVSRTVVDTTNTYPTTAGTIPVTYDNGIAYINFAAHADNITLAAPLYEGQQLTIVHANVTAATGATVADAHDGTVTVATAYDRAGATILYFVTTATEMQQVTLVGVASAAGVLAWRVLKDDNSNHPSWYAKTTATRTVTDPGAAAIPITYSNAYCEIIVGSAGLESATLAAPAMAGQTYTFACVTCGTGTRAITVSGGGFNTAGNTVMTFTAAAQSFCLTSVKTAAAYIWRLVYNVSATPS